jgi:hypothetical protein
MSIFRTPHIHAKVQGRDTALLTTQLYLPDAQETNERDVGYDPALVIQHRTGWRRAARCIRFRSRECVRATMDNTPSRWTINLLWIHAAWYLAIALACYISPEKVFGDSAWLPLARLAVLLFAAALTTTAIMLAGSAWSGSLSQIRTALLATFLLDVQQHCRE